MADNIERHALTKNQKLTIASTTTGFGLENMDGMFISFALSSIIASLHVSNFAGGMISTITSLGTLTGGILFGILADKIGRVKVFSSTIFIFAFATAAMYFAHNIWIVYFLRFLSGFGTGGEYGSGMTLIAENFKNGKIGKISSFASIGGQIGAMLAAIAAALIIPHFGWNALFLVGLLPVIFAFFVRRHLKDSTEFTKQSAKPEAEQSRGSIKSLFNGVIAFQTIGLTLMMMVQTGGYYGLMNWLPTIMQHKLGLSVSGSSTWMIVTIIGMSLGMLTFGTIMDHLGARTAFGVFLIVAAISVYAILFAFNAITLLIAAFVLGFFSNGMYGGYGVIVSRLYPTANRVTANNVISSVGKVLGGFCPALIGLLIDKYSLTIVMMFLSVMYLFSFVIMICLPALKNKNI